MADIDDIMRELRKQPKRATKSSERKEDDVEELNPNEQKETVEEKPSESTTAQENDSEPEQDSEPSADTQTQAVDQPEAPESDPEVNGQTKQTVESDNTPSEPSEALKEEPKQEQTTEGAKTSKQQRVPKHPDIEREQPSANEVFSNLSVADKLIFGDMFENKDGDVVYNPDHPKSVAKNLSKDIIRQVADDLKDKHLHARVAIGENQFTIQETNVVFTSPTSLMRYLLLNGIQDENMALQLARQLFLEKHPDGEKGSFNHKNVRTDERDVYALLLSTKGDPERDLVEKVEELTRTMDYIEEANELSNRKIFEQTTSMNDLINGVNIATSALLLERLGLTEGSLPRDLDSLRGFITQDNIVKLSDQLGNDIATEMVSRRRTMARDERSRGIEARQSRQPPKATRRIPRANRDRSQSR